MTAILTSAEVADLSLFRMYADLAGIVAKCERIHRVTVDGLVPRVASFATPPVDVPLDAQAYYGDIAEDAMRAINALPGRFERIDPPATTNDAKAMLDGLRVLPGATFHAWVPYRDGFAPVGVLFDSFSKLPEAYAHAAARLHRTIVAYMDARRAAYNAEARMYRASMAAYDAANTFGPTGD